MALAGANNIIFLEHLITKEPVLIIKTYNITKQDCDCEQDLFYFIQDF